MTFKSSFFALATRWGARPATARSMKLNYGLLTIVALLLLIMVYPAFAQDITPTLEQPPIVVTAAPPVVEVPADVHNAVDDVIEFFTNNLPIIFMGVTLIGLVFKVKEPQTQAEYDSERKAIAVAREDVKKTETKFDDLLVEARYILNEMRGMSASLPLPNPGVPPSFPPVAPPATNPSPPTLEPDDPNIMIGFTDVFGTMGNKQIWKQVGHADAVIEIPFGYSHDPVYFDGAGKPYPAKAIETNEKYGTRLNIAHIGSRHKFTRHVRVFAAKGRNIVTLDYEAFVNAVGVVGEPHYNWLWLHCYIDGKELVSAQVEGDTAHHIATKDGMQQAVWYYDSPAVESVELAFEVVIHWGLAGDMSYIDLKRAALRKQN